MLPIFFTALFEKTRVPDVLPLIFIGILIGPLFGIVSPADFGYVGPLLSAVALVLMLFEGGSHLTLETLKTSLKDCVILALMTFILTVIISAGTVYYLMGQDLMPAIFIGAVLGSISPAVVVPIVRMLNLSENTKSTLVVESAITDVLSIIIALGILKTFLSGHKSIMEFIGTNLIRHNCYVTGGGFRGCGYLVYHFGENPEIPQYHFYFTGFYLPAVRII